MTRSKTLHLHQREAVLSSEVTGKQGPVGNTVSTAGGHSQSARMDAPELGPTVGGYFQPCLNILEAPFGVPSTHPCRHDNTQPISMRVNLWNDVGLNHCFNYDNQTHTHAHTGSTSRVGTLRREDILVLTTSRFEG